MPCLSASPRPDGLASFLNRFTVLFKMKRDGICRYMSQVPGDWLARVHEMCKWNAGRKEAGKKQRILSYPTLWPRAVSLEAALVPSCGGPQHWGLQLKDPHSRNYRVRDLSLCFCGYKVSPVFSYFPG